MKLPAGTKVYIREKGVFVLLGKVPAPDSVNPEQGVLWIEPAIDIVEFDVPLIPYLDN